MKVLYASSEVFPFSKTGGLADVAGALPIALKEQGIDVSIITPLYKGIKEKFNLEETDDFYEINVSSDPSCAKILKTELGKKVAVYFVDCKKYYDRQELYTTKEGDWPDNAERFIFFSRVIVEFAIKNGFQVIHLNDWQTAMSAVYAKSLYQFKGKTILTIHNLGYQGLFWHFDMHLTKLGWDYFRPDALEFWGKINFLKGGIYFSDIVTTVSPTYAKEIVTEKDGFGLNGVLLDVKDKLYGILNGIDYNEWSPIQDKYIAENYDIKNVTKAKKICKQNLVDTLKIDSKLNVPVFGMISRLADQKGFDIFTEAVGELMKRDVLFIILGTGEKKYEELLNTFKVKFPNKIFVFIGFNNELAHKIEAGSDFFLMPSHYEPCGLNQMISMIYGTIPVVSSVGGLNDTVVDISEGKQGCGIKFSPDTANELINAIDRALELYKDPLKLARIRKNGMIKDFSWTSSAQKYIDLYKHLFNRRD